MARGALMFYCTNHDGFDECLREMSTARSVPACPALGRCISQTMRGCMPPLGGGMGKGKGKGGGEKDIGCNVGIGIGTAHLSTTAVPFLCLERAHTLGPTLPKPVLLLLLHFKRSFRRRSFFTLVYALKIYYKCLFG